MPHKEKQPVGGTEQSYVPASIPFEQSQRKVPFATSDKPDHICGVAVLPGFFVLEREVFIPCEQWRRHRRRGTH